jgi:chemotaxis protein MotD
VDASAASASVVSLGPVALDRLPDALASAARSLTSPSTAASAASAATTTGASPAAAQPVKELEIQLDPADLGAVSVKMRLSDGKLSVVMEVSKPSTLKAVESDRDAIADRLGSTAQSLESLVIRPASTNSTSSDGGDASNQTSEGRDNARSDPRGSGDSSSGGHKGSQSDSSADPWSRQATAREQAYARGTGDLLV